MKLIDTHAHIYLNQFDTDRDDIINKAIDAGVKKIILPDIDSTSRADLLNLCQQYPKNCFPLIGLHPTSVKQDTYQEEMQKVANAIEKEIVYGIGEIGLDLYWDKTYISQQIEALQFQLNLALKHNLPVVIHTRDAFKEMVAVMNDFKNTGLKGVFHSFTGTIEEALTLLDFGFYLGIGGIVSFKNAGLDKIVKELPLEKLVLETDSPYLTPTPHRGKRNEPAYTLLIAQKIADIHERPIEDIARITTKNALSLFQKL